MAADTKASTLDRLHALPDSALFTPIETAVYLNVRRDLLRSWRWRACGPPFVGHGHLIRYRKGALDRFLGEGSEPAAA
jgi:hypothetical protein